MGTIVAAKLGTGPGQTVLRGAGQVIAAVARAPFVTPGRRRAEPERDRDQARGETPVHVFTITRLKTGRGEPFLP